MQHDGQHQGFRRRLILWGSLALVLFVIELATAATVTMQWDYSQNAADPALTFTVYRQAACTGGFVGLGQVAFPTLAYADATVVLGQTYCWQVKAKDATGLESGASNTMTFQVPPGPQAPTNLRGTLGP